MPSSVSLKQLLETGVHFGHRKQKWNPKMEPYIFTQRNGIHILDLQQTLVNLNKYYDRVRDLVANGGKVLFVGTKRQAQETIAREADRCRMPYVNQRWLGGTLTNWSTIYDRIKTLEKLEGRRDRGELELLTKRERVMINRQIEKLQIRLGGIRTMKKLPQMIIVVDTVRENTAVREANKLEIPVLALVDSNSDPDEVDYIIPSNDDAMRSINLIVHTLAEAVIEGQNMRASFQDEDNEEYEDMSQVNLDRYDDTDDDGDDEEYLGEATLAKLRDSKLFDEDEEDEEDDE